jgi:hypothetical protein
MEFVLIKNIVQLTNMQYIDIYTDTKLGVNVSCVEGPMAALSVIANKWAKIAAIIHFYEYRTRKCSDLLYNITKAKMIDHSDETDYTGDQCLFIFFEKSQCFSQYSQNNNATCTINTDMITIHFKGACRPL